MSGSAQRVVVGPAGRSGRQVRSGRARRAARCSSPSCSRRRPRAAWPVTNDASSDARNSAADAISSGRPKRPSLCASRYLSGSQPMPPITDAEHRRVDEAGADAVHADADPAVVDRHVLGEQHDAALRRVVRAAALGALDPLDARDVDDAPRALRHHRGAARACTRGTCLRGSRGSHGSNSSSSTMCTGPPPATPAAVHHDVEATRARRRPRRPRRDRGLVGHVDTANDASGATASTSPPSGRARSMPATRAPSAAKRPRGRLADARRRARDQRRPSPSSRPIVPLPRPSYACTATAFSHPDGASDAR